MVNVITNLIEYHYYIDEPQLVIAGPFDKPGSFVPEKEVDIYDKIWEDEIPYSAKKIEAAFKRIRAEPPEQSSVKSQAQTVEIHPFPAC